MPRQAGLCDVEAASWVQLSGRRKEQERKVQTQDNNDDTSMSTNAGQSHVLCPSAYFRVVLRGMLR
jgi:hypothetical protein